MSTLAAPRSATARPVRTDRGSPLLPLPVARGAALLALCAFGALHWMELLDPAAPFRAWEAIGVAVLAVAGLLLVPRIGSLALRRVAAAVIAFVALGLALLAAGAADEYLRPDRWSTLVSGIGRGIETLPGARVPFRGVDEWTRTVLAMGGTVLTLLAAVLAFWPRAGGRTGYRVAALITLVTLYVVPTVALIFDREFLRGALLLLLVLVFLRLERMRADDAKAAGIVALGVAILALAIAPALDRPAPWWDYETWALSAASSKTTAFSWDHDYGPLDWPRDGRELLRVRATREAYWKAENLDHFDGAIWRQIAFTSAPATQTPNLDQSARLEERWRDRIRVSVRNLESREIVTAGAAISVDLRPRGTLRTSPGTIVAAGRRLRRGDAYAAEIYYPRPSQQQLRSAGTGYEENWLGEYRSIGLAEPGAIESSSQRVRFPSFGRSADPELVELSYQSFPQPARKRLERSQLRRTWALAQRLKAQSDTPYEYIQGVQRYLAGATFSYTETPPPTANTLDGFLFDAKSGFCQQYSGSMALLLRMGGVPARVSAGFTAGSLDRKTGEYVVRDLDAHSWVEAWFPGYGWVTFDPTPSAAPPRSQSDDRAAGRLGGAAGDLPGLGVPGGSSDTGSTTSATGGGTPWATIAGGAGILALLAWGGLVLRRRRAAERPRGPAPGLAELERALRRAGRGPGPGTTLNALEARFGTGSTAAGYVRALREQRYRPAAPGPTSAQRRGLRAELARGRGPVSRLRAWWALPPRLGRG